MFSNLIFWPSTLSRTLSIRGRAPRAGAGGPGPHALPEQSCIEAPPPSFARPLSPRDRGPLPRTPTRGAGNFLDNWQRGRIAISDADPIGKSQTRMRLFRSCHEIITKGVRKYWAKIMRFGTATGHGAPGARPKRGRAPERAPTQSRRFSFVCVVLFLLFLWVLSVLLRVWITGGEKKPEKGPAALVRVAVSRSLQRLQPHYNKQAATFGQHARTSQLLCQVSRRAGRGRKSHA